MKDKQEQLKILRAIPVKDTDDIEKL